MIRVFSIIGAVALFIYIIADIIKVKSEDEYYYDY